MADVNRRQEMVGGGGPYPGWVQPWRTAGQELSDDVSTPCATFLLLHGIPYKYFFSNSRIFYEDIKIDEPKNN
jgi:hypothetical protein